MLKQGTLRPVAAPVVECARVVVKVGPCGKVDKLRSRGGEWGKLIWWIGRRVDGAVLGRVVGGTVEAADIAGNAVIPYPSIP